MALCGQVRCASAQPLAPCLLAVDFAHTALDGEGDVSVFWVWGSRAFVHDLTSRLTSRFPFTVSSPTALPRRSSLLQVPLLVDPLPPHGPAPSGVSQVDPPPGAVPGEVVVDSSAARGTASGGAEPGGAEPGGAETGGTETRGATLGVLRLGVLSLGVLRLGHGGAASEGAESGGAELRGGASSGGSAGSSPRLSPQLC
ncbi:unnamed protein product [Closterium sp. NIES-54]